MQATLSEGIYSAKDVARILKLPYASVRYWMKEFWDKRFATKGETYSFGEKGHRAINFLTLIEFYTFYQLRNNGVSVQKIYKARKEISKLYGTKFPFALPSIASHGRHVWYEYLDTIFRADGKHQGALKEIIKPFLEKIEFEAGGAKRFFPLGKGHYVIVDPKIQFGQPTISGTRIPIETIYQLRNGGEKPESISRLYRIPLEAVNDVEEFYSKAAA